MPAGIHSFDAPLPSRLYWDASFIVNFAYEAARYFRQCADFLARLDEQATISYVSTLAMDEACFVLLQLSIEEDYSPTRFWDIYNANPGVIERYIDDLQALTEAIGAHPQIKLIRTEPVFALDSLAHMRTWHLLPRDAYHLAVLRYHGLESMVTLDGDFAPVSDIDIFSCNPAILQQER